MVYNGISVETPFPNEVLKISLDGNGSGFVLESNIMSKFDTFNTHKFTSKPAWVNSSDSSDIYQADDPFRIMSFPATEAVEVDLTNKSNYISNLYIRGTTDENPVITVLPTRIIPNFIMNSLTNIGAVLQKYDYEVVLSNQYDQGGISNYLDPSGIPTAPSYYLSGGPLHTKTEIDNPSFYSVTDSGTTVTTIQGSLGTPFSNLEFTSNITVSGEEVIIKTRQKPDDPTQLWSIDYTINNPDATCSYNAISGTCDPYTGDYELHFICGNATNGKDISATYVKLDESNASTLSILGSSPTISFQTTLPIYLYDFDVYVSLDNNDYYYGFSMVFLPDNLVENNGSSAVKLSPKMSTSYGDTMGLDGDHSKWRLVSEVGEDYVEGEDIILTDSLSNSYNLGNWIDGDNSFVTISSPGDEFNQFSFVVEISSTNGKTISSQAIINSNTGSSELILSGQIVSEDKRSYTLNTNPNYEIPTGTNVVFDIPENRNNSVIRRCDNNSVISLNTPVQIDNVECIIVDNVGFGTTTVFMSSESSGLSGEYIIESELSLDGFSLLLETEDLSSCGLETPYGINLSLINDQGNEFVLPDMGTICWEVSYEEDSNISISAENRLGEDLILDQCVPAYGNDSISAIMAIDDYSDFSESEIVEVRARYLDDENTVELISNLVELSPKSLPDPSIYNSFFDVFSGSNFIGSTDVNTSIPIGIGQQDIIVKLKENPTFSFNDSNVTWTLRTGPTIVGTWIGDDQTISFEVVSAPLLYILTLDITGAQIAGWEGREFCLSTQMRFIALSDTEVDFIAFPRNRFAGPTRFIQDFNNYTSSYGNTAYDHGHTETFYLSANPGHTSYQWKIKDFTKTTPSNTTTLDVRVDNDEVNIPFTIELSAYSDSVGDGAFPFIGSSDDSTPLKSHVRFISYPDIVLSGDISDDLFDLNLNSEEPFNIDLALTNSFPSPLKVINGGTAEITLSASTFGIRKMSIPLNSNSENIFGFFDLDPSNFFGISPNTYNNINIEISGTAMGIINPPNDFLSEPIETNTISIPVKVYHGPFLSISLDSYCVEVGTDVIFKNTTPSFPITDGTYTNFRFDDGTGTISETSANDEDFIGFYESPGTYSPSLTASLGGEDVVKVFDSMVIVGCGDQCVSYNSNYSRRFDRDLELPYSREELMLKPNERLTHETFNDSLKKIMDNFQYLNDNCQVYSLAAPTKLINDISLAGMELDLKVAKYKNKFAYGISNGGNIVILDFRNVENYSLGPLERFEYIKNDNLVTNEERLERPISIDLNSDGSKFAVLDAASKSIYIYSFNSQTQESKFIAYWGGAGSRTARTKFNSPVSVKFGQNDSLYVLDPESYIIKKYNKYFNWVSNVEHEDWLNTRESLISMSMDSDNYLYVLTASHNLYVFDDKDKFINVIKLQDVGELFFNKFSDGAFYVIKEREIIKYTKFGMRLNKWTSPTFLDNIIGVEQLGSILYIMTNKNIYVAFDCLTIDSIRSEEVDELFWTYDQIKIDRNEAVQDWVYNDSLSKLHQNIDMLRRTIYRTFITYINPFDNEKTEYEVAPIEKEDFDPNYVEDETYIGINEFVTYDVFNRVMSQLHSNMESVMKQIQSKPKNTRIECDDSLCYTWKKMTTNNKLQPNNCVVNPLSWVELKDNEIEDWNGLECEDAEKTEYELINFDLSRAKNRVPYKIDNCEELS